MYNFVVLGLVPGTNIQISFQAWLGMMGALSVALPLVWTTITNRLRSLRHTPAVRRTLHARELHQRFTLPA